jgi:pimeloyl-ACP methyl ester carboxylesterase
VEHRFDDLGGDVTIHVADAGPADGAPVMLVHGFPQNWWGVTVVGHSLGGGVAMQFA